MKKTISYLYSASLQLKDTYDIMTLFTHVRNGKKSPRRGLAFAASGLSGVAATQLTSASQSASPLIEPEPEPPHLQEVVWASAAQSDLSARYRRR